MQSDQLQLYRHNFTLKWYKLRLLNGWADYNTVAGATVWHPPSYGVTPDGWLVFTGMLSVALATSDVCATVPDWATPKWRAEISWAGYNTVAGYNRPGGSVQETGLVYIHGVANQAWVSLENTRVWLGA